LLDHLALMIELLGDIPRHLALSGRYSSEYFTRRGQLRNITRLKHWGLRSVLIEKYKMSREDASGLVDFLLPMLDYNIKRRQSAQDALKSPWLEGV